MTAGTEGTVLEPIAAPAPEAPEPPAPRRASRARRRQRRRFWFIAVPLAIVVVGASIALGELWRTTARPASVRPVASSTTAPVTTTAPVAAMQTVLVMHQTPDGASDFVMAVTAGGGQAFGQLTVLAPEATVLVPGRGPVNVRDLTKADAAGAPAPATAIEAALGLRVDQVAVLDDVAFRAVLDATGPLAVKAPAPATLAPNDAFTTLVTTTDPAVRRGILNAWMASLRDPLRSGPVLDVQPALGPLVVAASVRGTVVDVKSVPEGRGARFDTDALNAALATIPADAKLGISGVRPTVGIRDGVGDQAKLTNALRCLVGAGADIQKIDPVPAYQFDKTAVTYADATKQASAQAMRDALGVGTVAPIPGGANSFDITVFVGADFSQCPQ
ncbi:MAG: hypothetical protein ACOYNI_11625 [Acidimicrobiia bacterium]